MRERNMPCFKTLDTLSQEKMELAFKKRFYLFLERRREGERGRETTMCGCLSRSPCWGPGPHPRHMAWLGIKPVTLWFAGQHSVHWATPTRAWTCTLNRSTKLEWEYKDGRRYNPGKMQKDGITITNIKFSILYGKNIIKYKEEHFTIISEKFFRKT